MALLELSRTTRAQDVMVKPAIVRFDTPLREAARRLAYGEGDAVLVTRGDGRFAGLLTKRTLVLGAQAEAEGHSGYAGEYATGHFVTVGPEETLESVFLKLDREGARRAVVVEGGSPVGLISVLIAGPSADDDFGEPSEPTCGS